MKKKFSTSWNSSKQPRKQRKYRHNAPLHIRGKFMTSKLSDALSEKHNAKKARLRVGDKVKVLVGKFRNHEGKVEFLDVKKSKARISGAEVNKKDGSKVKVPIHASNLVIIDLNLDDKKRMERAKTKVKRTEEKK
jgi:large subunit ribosomal protein L24